MRPGSDYRVLPSCSHDQRPPEKGDRRPRRNRFGYFVFFLFCSVLHNNNPPPSSLLPVLLCYYRVFLLDNKADLTQIGRREYVALILSFVLPIFPKGTVIISTVYVVVKSESNRVIKPKKRKGSSREKKKESMTMFGKYEDKLVETSNKLNL